MKRVENKNMMQNAHEQPIDKYRALNQVLTTFMYIDKNLFDYMENKYTIYKKK